MKDNRPLPKPCTKPDCDCIDHAEKKAGGPVKSYPCLAGEPDWDLKKSEPKRSAEDLLKHYETYVKHSYVPIYLHDNVLELMEEYASQFKSKDNIPEPDSQWISVGDKMPEGIGDVLLLTSSKVCTIGDWYCLEWRTQNDIFDPVKGWQPTYKKEDITHWQPLPSPPYN